MKLSNERSANRFGYGSMFLPRMGRVDGLRFELGFGLVLTDAGRTHGGVSQTTGAIVLHNALVVPFFRTDATSIGLEARSDFAILDPFFWIPTVGLRARVGPLVFGVRGNLMAHASSLMLWLGYHREGTVARPAVRGEPRRSIPARADHQT